MQESSKGRTVTGRSSAALLVALRHSIQSGKVASGDFLPPVRRLCAENDLSIETVCAALRNLAKEGLVVSVPRRGYRVLPRANDPTRGCPIACVIPHRLITTRWESLYGAIQSAVEHAAARRGWQAIGLAVTEGREAEFGRHLAAIRAWGVILDSMDTTVLELTHASGLPAVLVDIWVSDARFDVVLQDNFGGAYQAAQHLLARGHTKIGWFGPIRESQHSRERYGGAAAALAEVDMDLIRMSDIATDSPRLADAARHFLARRSHPTGLLALWPPMALALASAARELGLVRGRDFDMVCWCAEEVYESVFLPALGGGAKPPTIVWSAAEMGEVAVARLAERCANPQLPPLRTYIGTRLLAPSVRREENPTRDREQV